MILKNNRAPLRYYVKLCPSFQSHRWIRTWVTVRKHSIRVKIGDFFYPVWPWNLMDDLEKQQGASSILCQALGVISKPLVNSNFSYSTEMLNSGQNQATLRHFMISWVVMQFCYPTPPRRNKKWRPTPWSRTPFLFRRGELGEQYWCSEAGLAGKRRPAFQAGGHNTGCTRLAIHKSVLFWEVGVGKSVMCFTRVWEI